MIIVLYDSDNGIDMDRGDIDIWCLRIKIAKWMFIWFWCISTVAFNCRLDELYDALNKCLSGPMYIFSSAIIFDDGTLRSSYLWSSDLEAGGVVEVDC